MIIFFAVNDGETLYSQGKKKDLELMVTHQFLISKFRLKLKKVGKITGIFRYDLSQIHYDNTVEVMNKFRGLDLIECLKNYGWRSLTLFLRQ